MLLQLKNIQKSIGVEEILHNVSFIIEEKEKVALVGVNGAGKTSVFRLITGEWQPDEGAITCSADTRIGYLPQLAEADTLIYNESDSTSNMTLYESLDSVFEPLKRMEAEIRVMEKKMATESGDILENTMSRYSQLMSRFESQGGYESASRVRGVLKGLGFLESQWQQPVALLSGGQRTRAQLGKRLLEKADLLLLDEPTNHLDIESVAWLEEYLRNFPGAILLISHDRYFMDRVVTKTIEIENKKSIVYNGNYSFFASQKAANREVAQHHYDQQQKVIKHHEEVIKTLRSYKTEAAIIRAKSREKLLDKIERVDRPEEQPDSMRLRLTPKISSGADVLTIEGIDMGFDGKPLFADVTFDLKKGDRTALVGPNGIGKTTLLKILVGELTPLAGRIREGVNVRLGYYDQAQQRLSDEKTIFQELADTYPRLTQTEIRNVLAAFIFTGDDVFKPISALSGGERGRVALAKIMLAGANFLVLDEPTNHLDLFSKEILEEGLREFTGTVLYISHDRYFINHTATKVLELGREGITEYLGNYDYYLEKKQAMQLEVVNTAQTISAPATTKQDWIKKKENESQARRQKARVSKLEMEIAETEEHIARCDNKLNEEAIARDAQTAAALYAEKIEWDNKLSALYDEWAELNDV